MRPNKYLSSLMTMLLLTLEWTAVQGFVTNRQRRTQIHNNVLVVSAKKAQNAKSSSGFGFKQQKVVIEQDDDYALFPPLEPAVMQTLIPDKSATESFSDEIYQRLDQIYGFPNFNYDSKIVSTSIQDPVAATAPPTASFERFLRNPADTATNDSSQSSSDDVTEQLALDRIPAFPNVTVLHIDPLIVSIKDFFTAEECDRYIELSSNNKNAAESRQSPTVGKDAIAKAQRTSTTWYHHFHSVPELMAKAARLLGLDAIDQWEEPQTVRYRRNEKFTWHLDALGPPAAAGQRIATLLVYLTTIVDERDGGATVFRDLTDFAGKRLAVRPEKGTALLFFPAAGGIPNTPFDLRTLHCGQMVAENAVHDKWIAQLWLRKRPYSATAPPGNRHSQATTEINNYCNTFQAL